MTTFTKRLTSRHTNLINVSGTVMYARPADMIGARVWLRVYHTMLGSHPSGAVRVFECFQRCDGSRFTLCTFNGHTTASDGENDMPAHAIAAGHFALAR